jgi:hypothetical protein
MTPAAQQPNTATLQHTSRIIHFPVHHLSPLLCRGVMWGHPHTALLPLLCSPLHIRAALSLAPAISVSPANGPFGAPASETKSAVHAYPLCQPANGRTDRTEETRINGGLSEPHHQSGRVVCQTQIKKKQPSNTSARKQHQTAWP